MTKTYQKLKQIITEAKVCCSCNKLKNLDEFYYKKGGRLERASDCKECFCEKRKEHYLRNTEIIKLSVQKYREKNRDYLLQKNKEYMSSDKGRKIHREASKKYSNKTEITIIRRFRQRIYDAKKRFLKETTSDGTITIQAIKKLYKQQKGKCAISGRSLIDGFHIDHIIPLSKNGIHSIKNIQLLFPQINLIKSNKLNFQYE